MKKFRESSRGKVYLRLIMRDEVALDSDKNRGEVIWSRENIIKYKTLNVHDVDNEGVIYLYHPGLYLSGEWKETNKLRCVWKQVPYMDFSHELFFAIILQSTLLAYSQSLQGRFAPIKHRHVSESCKRFCWAWLLWKQAITIVA